MKPLLQRAERRRRVDVWASGSFVGAAISVLPALSGHMREYTLKCVDATATHSHTRFILCARRVRAKSE
jgi:hypothetical protein